MRRFTPRLAALAGLLALLTTLAFIVDVPNAARLRADFGAAGLRGLLLFAALYALLSLLPLPLSVLTIAAGAVFGLGQGLAGVLLGAWLGAMTAFGIARALGRDAVQRITGRRASSLDAQLQRRGLPAVLGIRLVPVLPFTAVNYLSGLTAVRFYAYALGTAIGIVPGTAAYVTVGAYGRQPGSWPFWSALAGLGLLAGVGMLRWRRATTR